MPGPTIHMQSYSYTFFIRSKHKMNYHYLQLQKWMKWFEQTYFWAGFKSFHMGTMR